MRGFLICLLAGALSATAFGELTDTLAPSPDHPAIAYFNAASDPVAELGRQIDEGKAHLQFQGVTGYLRSLLDALRIPVESQVAVFSKTSFQAALIEPGNPRTLFFNDAVALGWMGGGFIELAAQDPRQGIHFYVLRQSPVDRPAFERRDSCLSCHLSDASLGVPGTLVRSTYTGPEGMPRLLLGAFLTDHRSPLEERWGGWYVTGYTGRARHLGNALLTDPDHPESMVTQKTLNLSDLREKFDTHGYLSPYSDVAALLVFNHQMHLMDLITRTGWEVRAALTANRDRVAADAAKEFVDYLLFADEAPLPGKLQSTSGFAAKFEAAGPRDRRGRSLRQLALTGRLMRYPCSYLIYSAAFDGLPAEARLAIYRRMWTVLSGREKTTRYSRLSLDDRRAVVEILRETKPGLPDFFQPVTQ